MIGVALTTVVWVTVTLLTPPEDPKVLQELYDRIRPLGRGGQRVVDTRSGSADSPAAAIACWVLGCVFVYGSLFGTGYALYGKPVATGVAGLIVVASGVALFRLLPYVGLRS